MFCLYLVPASFRDKANPNFTIKRMYDSAREEFEKLERLREVCCSFIVDNEVACT